LISKRAKLKHEQHITIRQCSQLMLAVLLLFFQKKSKFNIYLLVPKSECPAPMAAILDLGQAD